MPNLNWNGVTAEDGSLQRLDHHSWRFAGPPGHHAATALRRARAAIEYLNPAAGCREWPTVNITTHQSATAPLSVCEVDFQDAYIMLQPEIERKGLSTALHRQHRRERPGLRDGQLLQDRHVRARSRRWASTALPTAAATRRRMAAYNVILPVYVCSHRRRHVQRRQHGLHRDQRHAEPVQPVRCCWPDARRLFLRSPYGRTVDTSSRAIARRGGHRRQLRATTGATRPNFTASEIGLTAQPGQLLDPAADHGRGRPRHVQFLRSVREPQEVWDYIAPTNSTYSVSKLWQVQGTIAQGPVRLAGRSACRRPSVLRIVRNRSTRPAAIRPTIPRRTTATTRSTRSAPRAAAT